MRSGIGRRRAKACRCCRSSRYLLLFLVIPTITVVVGAFQDDGRFTLDRRPGAVSAARLLTALWKSVLLSGCTALFGAVFGAVLAYLVVQQAADQPRSAVW